MVLDRYNTQVETTKAVEQKIEVDWKDLNRYWSWTWRLYNHQILSNSFNKSLKFNKFMIEALTSDDIAAAQAPGDADLLISMTGVNLTYQNPFKTISIV